MKKYCRYCAYCCYGDIPYCEIKKQTMSEEKIKRVNNCKKFLFNEIDVLNPFHTYSPHKSKKIDNKQLTLFDLK